MAITNAQQYQQLVKKDANGKRPGYRGDAAYRSASLQSTNIGQGNVGSKASFGGDDRGGGSSAFNKDSKVQNPTTRIGGEDYDVVDTNVKKRQEAEERAAAQREREKNEFITTDNTPSYVPGYLKFLSGNNSVNRKFFYDKVLAAGKIPGLNYGEDELEQAYQDYMNNRMAGKTDAYGNPVQGFSYDDGILTGNFIDDRDDGAGQKILPEDTMGDTEEDEINPRDYTGLAPRFMGSSFDFTGLADGGRAGAMDGGRMRQMEMMEDEDDPTGGIMDLESGRQMYFLGKLVKKAGRAIKKVVKSPIGKAALLYFGGNALMGAGGGKGLGSFFGKGSFNPLRMAAKATSDGPMTQLSPFGKILSKLGMATGEEGGKLTLAGKLGLNYGLPFALSAMSADKDKDEDGPINYGLDIDIDAIRANPYKFLPAGIIGSNYQRGTEGRKDGGRMGYQEGGDAEPVAKKTMPLLDMDGKEMDLRAEGGFVPLGRMERADDVPARLSKNEFVFTADAVRNAGEGDIDKGAEVMYNMMKNLESGGEVSEESQGLDGAREMFKTSQRLEEVL